MPAVDDHYEILGVTRQAGIEEIRAAYRRAAKTAHPDRGGSNEAFLRLQRAAEFLLAELQTRSLSDTRASHRAGDRTSVGGDWLDLADQLRARWGSSFELPMVFAPQRLGLTPFSTATTLNAEACNWLNRTAGPRGEAWDFHIDGSQTRIFFRRADDAKLFKMKFI
jgi:curved DNA-binding protein CbpA